jgi:hypothetical protein
MVSMPTTQDRTDFDATPRSPGEPRRPWQTPRVIRGELEDAEAGPTASAEGGTLS